MAGRERRAWVRLAPPVGKGAGTGFALVPGRTDLFATREI
jgi:hypothetical protein